MKNSIKTLGILAVLFFLMMGLLVAPAVGEIVGDDKQSGPPLSASVKISVDITGDTTISQQYQGGGSAVIHVHADQNETKVTLTTKDGTQVTTAPKQGE